MACVASHISSKNCMFLLGMEISMNSKKNKVRYERKSRMCAVLDLDSLTGTARSKNAATTKLNLIATVALVKNEIPSCTKKGTNIKVCRYSSKQ